MFIAVFLVCVAVVTALPTQDPVVFKLDEGSRYQYMLADDSDTPELVDLWVRAGDLAESARYNPDTQNQYHLFTRNNPSVSQPLLLNNLDIVANSNYDADKRTIILVHGWRSSAGSGLNSALVPAFLSAEDVNVIVVDWSVGAGSINYAVAVLNAVTSGQGIARFITWLNEVSGSTVAQYHLAGFSLGGHAVGVTGRNLDGKVPYITSLDPAGPGWNTNPHRFQADDGIYTEIIHTNSGIMGYLPTLGNVDFYPNGGVTMPGCITQNCNHDRAYFYFAESLTTGGFKGTRCDTYMNALTGNCDLPEELNMGGIEPKTGETGIYYMATNASPPFSRD